MLYLEEYTYNRGKRVYDASHKVAEVFAQDAWKQMLSVQAEKGVMSFVISHEEFPEEFYRGLKRNTLLVRMGVGYDSVPIALCKELGILVANTPGTLNQSVAEQAIGMLLTFVRRAVEHDQSMKQGQWKPLSGQEIAGKTLAVIGFGSIGRQIAKIAKLGFGMRIVAFDKYEQAVTSHPDLYDVYTDNLKQAFGQADFVSINLNLSSETNKIINAEVLGAAKKEVVLINTSRGGVMDEDALYDALKRGTIAGACLDVFTREPYVPLAGKDLRTLGNVLLAPHVASNTMEANDNMARSTLESIRLYEEGELSKIPIVPELRSLIG